RRVCGRTAVRAPRSGGRRGRATGGRLPRPRAQGPRASRRGCATSPRTTPAGRRRSRTSRRARRGVCSSGARGTAASFAPWAPRARVRDARGRSAGRVATLDEERDLGGVVGEPDRGVVGGSRLVVAAVSAQQVGAGGV